MLYSLLLAAGAVCFVKNNGIRFVESLCLSSSAACIFLGMSALLKLYEPQLEPIVGNYGIAGHWSPLFGFITYYLKIFYVMTALFIALFTLLQAFDRYLGRALWLQIGCCLLFCVCLQAMLPGSTIQWMIFSGIIKGFIFYIIYKTLLCHDSALLPLMIGFMTIMIIIPELSYPSCPGIFLYALITIVVVFAAALFFYERAQQE